MRYFLLVLVLLLGLPLPGGAEELSPWEFGLRGGMNATGTRENYVTGEAYLLRDFPWQTDAGGGVLATRLDLGAGYLASAGDRGGYLAAGVDLVWVLAGGQIEVEAGFRPAWLIDHAYGEDDLGGDLQFVSHAGLALKVSRLVLSYRAQHISNAGLYADNDGLNLHLFGVGARF